MKPSKIRTIVAAIAFTVLALGLILGIQTGTLSGFGWDTISALCPLGAFTTMLATKTLVPRAIISIVLMAILVLIVGRAFCGWICPIPLAKKVGQFFSSAKKKKEKTAARTEQIRTAAKLDMAENGTAVPALTEEELASLRHDCTACGACKTQHKKLDSRHYVLGGALLSTAIFGFPVFCLICPVGLTFATVLLFWRLFTAGDVTLSVILVPAMLIIELVFLRKWCTRFCPLAGLMNLLGRFAKPLRPVIDDSKCIETTTGKACSKCAIACEADINIRHLEYGERTLADCTRCHACVEACPTQAITMSFIPKGGLKGAKGEAKPLVLSAEDVAPKA